MCFQNNSDGETIQSQSYMFSTYLPEPEQRQEGAQSAKLNHKHKSVNGKG